MRKYLSDTDTELYQKQGAILIKNIFKPWIDLLRDGFEKVLNKPGPHARENVTNKEGRFLKTIAIGKEYMNLKSLLKSLLRHR